ncbi:MAG: histidine ammonia-lyase [Saprospiraceae bacterium]|nr:histidine ammonia-lyase [Saprospiraceae bacterium]MCF8249525.1 histidine ammonia-lyase [Saprospiraceae bacterium]MCF8280150.1 histidine ammonia-lyase [Bacteroidales bacterium]MCF8310743.1 histidine ammonia-lyase [Saprospiraceae bacterium]MCF8439426.1 histidine ammonia-lyase [Saprospiraceae bacterium]
MHQISPDPLTLEQVGHILSTGEPIALSAEAINSIGHCRLFLENKLAASGETFYGINTGFGSLCNVRIGHHELEQLQLNLVMSHACGMGEEVPADVVRLMLLLKIQGLSQGFSGVQLDTVQRLVDFFNADLLPVIYQQGSLGASGDLAPLAHLSLALIGMGEVHLKGERMAAADALKKFGWEPLRLQSKEGLALLNGTQFCQAYGVWCLLEARRLYEVANRCAAISIDAFDCRLSPYNELLHKIRPHEGQLKTAEAIRNLLETSELAASEKTAVQDPYAFRCVPQVHGASYDAITHVERVFSTEINSVTDNPTIFPDDDAILSGGNFHAQPLALTLDYLAIALAELGSISERRTYQLISGQRGLPHFLTKNGGVNSGFMIPQYTAASIVSQTKQLCTPASVDSIVSSNGQEDHVSMGANAATKAWRVVKNVERVLAIEFYTAAQAMEFRRPLRSSEAIETMLSEYRKVVPMVEEDRIMSVDMEATVEFLQSL